MKILTNKMRGCRKGPSAWFTGAAWIDEIAIGLAPSRLRANWVSFEPGARTAWHTHPVGQVLHVVSGTGRVQLKGEPATEIRPGDTVWIDAGEVHWHGAAPARMMIHMAVQETDEHGVDVVWLEHVSEEEYLGPGE